MDICPKLFELSGDVAVSKAETVPSEAEESCRDAAKDCPVEAISLK